MLLATSDARKKNTRPALRPAFVRSVLITMWTVLAIPATATDSPDLLADFGGGNTELREASVTVGDTVRLGGLTPQIESSGAVSEISDMRIRYKLYTLLGEPVFDALLFWQLSSSAGANELLYNPQFRHGLDEKVERATGMRLDGVRSISRTELSEYPDLLDEFDRIKPLAVTIRATIGIEGTRAPSNSRLSLADLETVDRQRARSVRAEIDLEIDLPNRSGAWQRLSVPYSPDWDDFDPIVKEVFARRELGEDVVVYEAELKRITWPDFEIHSIAEDYLSREIEKAEAELSDEEFFSLPPVNVDSAGVLEEDATQSRLERAARAREREIEREASAARRRAERLADSDSGIDLVVSRRSDGGRDLTVAFDRSMEGIEVVFLNDQGEVTMQSDSLYESEEFGIDGTPPLVRFFRNGELVAEFSKLAGAAYTTPISARVGSSQGEWEWWFAGGFVVARYAHFPSEFSLKRDRYSYDFIRGYGANVVLTEDPDRPNFGTKVALLTSTFALREFRQITVQWRINGSGIARIGLMTGERDSAEWFPADFAMTTYLLTTHRTNAEGRDVVQYVPADTTLYTVIEADHSYERVDITTYDDESLADSAQRSVTFHTTAVRNNNLFSRSVRFHPFVRFSPTSDGASLTIESIEVVQ